MKRLALLVPLVLMLAGFGPTEEVGPYAPPEFLAQPPPLPDGYDASKAMQLDLPETLRIAMAHNLGLQVDRTSVTTADLGVDSARWGLYEPQVGASYTHTGPDQPGGAGSDTWSLSASQHIPTGGTISVGGSATRSPDTRSTLESLSITFTQPLLRGFSRDLVIPRYSILTARIGSEQARLELEIKAAALVQQTESAYWEVVSSLYSYGVAVKAQQAASETVMLVERQIAVGMIATADLTGAENTFARSRIGVLTAAQQVERSWDGLRTILALPRDQWDRPLLPTDRPRFVEGAEVSGKIAFDTAMKRRPELRSMALDLEASTLALRKAQNDSLPQIDFSVTGSVTGRDSSYTGAFSQLGSQQPAGWSAGISLSWTPMGKTAKINKQLARIHRDVQEVNRQERVQDIWNDVRTAVRGQQAAALEVVAASQSRKLASQSLEIEMKKYASGQSSNINIATLQNGLAAAEVTELDALIAHQKARTAVLLATGQLLDERHIDLKVVR